MEQPKTTFAPEAADPPPSPEGETDRDAITIARLSKTFHLLRRRIQALQQVDLEIPRGQMVALIGASGSGKSTLLRHLCGLEHADAASGRLDVFGRTVQEDGRIDGRIRQTRRHIGFIAQQFNLVPRLSLLKNVLAGMLGSVPCYRSWTGVFGAEEKRIAMAALDRVGLADFAAQRARNLSGGQQQRGAIARALVQGAELILADEPIASLDPTSSRRVMSLLSSINRDLGVTIAVSLHQVEYARYYCQRVVALESGRVVFDGSGRDLSSAVLHRIYGKEAEDAGIDELVSPLGVDADADPSLAVPKSLVPAEPSGDAVTV